MDAKVKRFMEENSLKKIISFSGGSDDQGDIVDKVIEESIIILKDYPVAVLTGGTRWGIPKKATEIAKDYGMKTIGVMPQRGEKNACAGLDLQLVIDPRYGGSEYGDESEVFAKLSDAVEIIGGSMGTAIEFFHIMKINDRRLDPKYLGKAMEDPDGERPIVVAPISGIKGFSSDIYCLTLSERLKSVIPGRALVDGSSAAKYILSGLEVFGAYKV